MKYLVISDIHGSSSYLKKVLLKVNDFDKLIILGDILYHGPRNNLPQGYNPKEVVNILNSIKDKIIAIRGNCDAKVDLMVLEFPISDHKWIDYNGIKILLTHGDEYSKHNLCLQKDKYVMIYGHYHINEIVNLEHVLCINLGSLSLPKDNMYSYGIISDDRFTSYNLENDDVIYLVNLK